VRNRAARDDSELHQSRCNAKCKSEKMLESQNLQRCGNTPKIRRYLVPWGFDSPSRHHDFLAAS